MPSSPQSQRRALIHDRDVTKVSAHATAPLGAVSIKLRAAVLRAMRQGNDIGSAIRQNITPMQKPLTQAMTASFVMGLYRSNLTAQQHLDGKRLSLATEFVDPLGRWEKIVEFAMKRVQISEAELAGINQGFELQSTAAIQSMGGKLELGIRKAILDAVRAGEHREGTIGAVRRAFDAAGMTNVKPFLIETQARTQTQLAYAAGKLAANEDPDIQEILYGYEYVTTGDDRVRPGHAALDGLRLPKDHPRWQEIMPPCGWNCRCTVIEIFNDESHATPNDVPEYVTVDGVRTRAGADEGFAFNPLDVFNGQLVGV